MTLLASPRVLPPMSWLGSAPNLPAMMEAKSMSQRVQSRLLDPVSASPSTSCRDAATTPADRMPD